MNNAMKDFLKLAVLGVMIAVFVILGINSQFDKRFASIENRIGSIEKHVDSIENRLEKIENILLEKVARR